MGISRQPHGNWRYRPLLQIKCRISSFWWGMCLDVSNCQIRQYAGWIKGFRSWIISQNYHLSKWNGYGRARALSHEGIYFWFSKHNNLHRVFQAVGTRGQTLVQGIERIKIHGEYFPVRAEIVNQEVLYANADYQEILGGSKTSVTLQKRYFWPMENSCFRLTSSKNWRNL